MLIVLALNTVYLDYGITKGKVNGSKLSLAIIAV